MNSRIVELQKEVLERIEGVLFDQNESFYDSKEEIKEVIVLIDELAELREQEIREIEEMIYCKKQAQEYDGRTR